MMATIAEKYRKELVNKAQALINEWLQTKINTPMDIIFKDNETKRRYAGWDIPGIKLSDDSITVLEDGTLAVTLQYTHTLFFKVRSRGMSQFRRAVASDVFDEEILSGIITTLEHHLAK